MVMHWIYKARWIEINGLFHIDNLQDETFTTTCGETYSASPSKELRTKEQPKEVCKKCERLMVQLMLRLGPPPTFKADESPELNYRIGGSNA